MRGAGRPRRAGGNALLAFLVFVVVCASLSSAVLLSTSGTTREAGVALDAERAFQMAEAGIDWGVARVRRAPGGPLPEETVAVHATGDFTVTYVAGDKDELDEDGDGVVDDADERVYTILRSTGRSGGIERRIEATAHSATSSADFRAAIQFNVLGPQLDLKGNALTVSGAEHFLDGTIDASRPPKPGIGSPALASLLAAQIPAKLADDVVGAGEQRPSVAQIGAILTGPLAQQAAGSADVTLPPGTHANERLGTPTTAGALTVYCGGDLHLSGGASGAGLLVVDGNLKISGGFSWVGLVVVRGTATFTGGGHSARLIGALVVDEGVGSGAGCTTVTATGTVDVLYSSDAVDLATRRLAGITVVAWREIGLR